MEGFSQRGSALLGFSPQRSFMNDHNSSPSDIDFNDVFGGPPRRSSMFEIRGRYSEATDKDDDEIVASPNSRNGIREKPVFGEEGLNRRHYPNENFFNDIFRGNGSLSSSPRKRDWDPYSSSPGSRVLSPVWTLPPKADPFGTSPPAQFSLPAKLTKGTELSTFGSAPRVLNKNKDGALNGVTSPLSRSSSLNQGYEDRNDTQSSYRQSILSRELSMSVKDADTETGNDSKMQTNGSEDLSSGIQFHFSIYKWASKGVPLVMPLRGENSSNSKENHNMDRRSSSDKRIESERVLPKETMHDSELPSNLGVSADTKSFKMEHDKQNNGIHPDASTQDRVETWPRADPGDTTSQITGEKTKSHQQSEIGLHNKLKNVSEVIEEDCKPEMKPLCSLLFDDDYEQSNWEIPKKTAEKESRVKGTKTSSVVPDFGKSKTKQDGKWDSAEVGKDSLRGSPMNSRGPGKTRAKGKVKDFIKIFNHEGLSKSKISVDRQSQSFRQKDTDNSKAEKVANFITIATDMKIQMSSEHEKKSFNDAPIKVNGNLPHSEKQQSATKNTSHMSNQTSGRKDSSSTEALANGSKAVDGDIDEFFQGNFLVKELTDDENKLGNAGNDPKEIQDIDNKIRKWSNGKKGNIRSLLSTLQYVLWPGSGWKPVPLVDIIDGNAVKRSYQKALLCLHPDKLQQKGATFQQNYIAEKVFDILRDSWTHFCSLESL